MTLNRRFREGLAQVQIAKLVSSFAATYGRLAWRGSGVGPMLGADEERSWCAGLCVADRGIRARGTQLDIVK